MIQLKNQLVIFDILSCMMCEDVRSYIWLYFGYIWYLYFGYIWYQKLPVALIRRKAERSGQQTEKHRMNLSGSYHKGYSQHLQYLDSNKSSPKDLSPPRNGCWKTLFHWVLHMPPLWGTPNHSSPPYTSCNALSAGCNYSGSSATC